MHAFKQELVALSGAHTIGRTGTTKPPSPLDPITPVTFDNTYFVSLLAGAGPFVSDRTLATTPATLPFVAAFAASNAAFFESFARAYVVMGLHGTHP